MHNWGRYGHCISLLIATASFRGKIYSYDTSKIVFLKKLAAWVDLKADCLN